MSYDFTIRRDESFSQLKPLAPTAAFLVAQPHLKSNGSRSFVLEDGNRRMEIDLETVSEEGDTIEDESTDPETFNCIRAHIPYLSLGEDRGRDYLRLLRSIAEHLSWELHDEQSEEEPLGDDAEPKRPWWKFW